MFKNRYDACKERQLNSIDTCFCYELLLCFYLGPLVANHFPHVLCMVNHWESRPLRGEAVLVGE